MIFPSASFATGNAWACSRAWTNAGPATSLAAAEGIELALLGNRFRVTLSAVDPRTGNIEVGQAMPQGDRFGYFSLPDFTGDPAFPEVLVKMADATSPSGGSFWVFHTGLTDLQYTMTVTDTVTGAVRIYQNDRSDLARLCGGAAPTLQDETPVIPSPSPSRVIPSAARDLLCPFNALLQLRAGSARDLPPSASILLRADSSSLRSSE